MPYKFSLGAKLMPRQQYLDHVWSVREPKGHIVLPANHEPLNAKSLIDQVPLCDALQSKVEMDESKDNGCGKGQANHPPQSRKCCTPPEKKRSKNTQVTTDT